MNNLLHTQQKMGGSEKGRGSAQAGNTPSLPCDGVWYHHHHQVPRRPQSWNHRAWGYFLAPPTHAEGSEPQRRHSFDRNKVWGRAGGGQWACGSNPTHHLLFCMAYELRTNFTFLSSWKKLKGGYFVMHEIQISTSINKVVLAHSHAHWFVSCPQMLWHGNGEWGQLRQRPFGPQSLKHLLPSP